MILLIDMILLVATKPLRRIENFSAQQLRVYQALWTPDSRQIVTCGEDSFINVFDVEVYSLLSYFFFVLITWIIFLSSDWHFDQEDPRAYQVREQALVLLRRHHVLFRKQRPHCQAV